MDNKDMYTTKVTLEVEVSHHQTTDPIQAIDMIFTSLSYPAIQKIRLIGAESNFKVHQPPSKDFHFVRIY